MTDEQHIEVMTALILPEAMGPYYLTALTTCSDADAQETIRKAIWIAKRIVKINRGEET